MAAVMLTLECLLGGLAVLAASYQMPGVSLTLTGLNAGLLTLDVWVTFRRDSRQPRRKRRSERKRPATAATVPARSNLLRRSDVNSLCEARPGGQLRLLVEDRHEGRINALVFDGVTCEAVTVEHVHRGCFEEFAVTLAGSGITDVAAFFSDQDRSCSCGGDYCLHLRLADQLRADGHV